MRLYWLIVALALGLVAYLGHRVAGDRASVRDHEVQRLLDERLVDVKSRVGQAMGRIERGLLARLANGPTDIEALRALAADEPLARQAFRVDRDGRLTFPTPRSDASAGELAFLSRTESIWQGRAVLYQAAAEDERAPAAHDAGAARDAGATDPRAAAKTRAVEVGPAGDSLLGLAERAPHGWLSWYWAEGLHLLFWRRTDDGGVIGVEVERIGVLAAITAALPTTELSEGRMLLANSRGGVVHQWGPYEPVAGDVPVATVALDHPLDAWRLDYVISPAQARAFAGESQLGLLLGLGAACVALLGLAVYVHREYGRTMRDAAERVSFVTQVSHELKTPLTNIRIYAELMADRLDDDDEGRRKAGVIVSESERLSRLINNILAFARHRKGALELEPAWIALDPVVRDALVQFGPAFEARGIRVTAELAAARQVRADRDAVEQVVSNLLSNVDKYAASGGEVTVTTFERGETTVVRVSDNGPGIPVAQREAVFRPFYRLSDRLADGVTGTGIGLSIARELARSSGGELALVESEAGACFELSLINREAGDEGTDR